MRVWVLSLLLLGTVGVAAAIVITQSSELGIAGNSPAAEHVEQETLRQLVATGQRDEAFEAAFDGGDELFETVFNSLDGVGANVGGGQRFTSVPRADLRGNGEWFNHQPARFTGPNASSCISCHARPFDDGAGDPSTAVHRDPLRNGNLAQFIQRDTPPLFGLGGVQRVAEEMTAELQRQQESLRQQLCQRGGTASVNLSAKNVSFGTLSGTRSRNNPCSVNFNTDGVRGVDTNLVVRPFQWKGSVATLREFVRDASHNELGMQAVELVGDGIDGDSDGVTGELTVGDVTAMSVYLAAQPRPTTLLELASLDLIEPLPATQINAINRGRQVFSQIGCDSCHTPSMTLDDPTFAEPSRNAAYRDARFPAGQNPQSRGVDAQFAVTFDLTRDQPDNHVDGPDGLYRLGSLRRDRNGRATVEMFTDLKRHEMGPQLAEAVNEVEGNRQTPSTWLTKSLWGVGSTAPYMHDGRATTLVEAILEHATGNANDTSEAADARRRYVGLPAGEKQALIAFLDNLVIFKLAEEAGQPVATIAPNDVTLRVPRGRTHRRTR